MPLNVKNDEAHDLARELFELTGATITEAVTLALRDALVRERRRRQVEQTRRVLDLLQIATECGGLPVLNDRAPDEFFAFDEHGAYL